MGLVTLAYKSTLVVLSCARRLFRFVFQRRRSCRRISFKLLTLILFFFFFFSLVRIPKQESHKMVELLRSDIGKMRDENGALIRVISKLSK